MAKTTLNLKSLSATKLRLVLFVAIAGLLLGQIGLISAGQRIISSFSDPVSQAVTESASSQQTLRDLETVKLTLDKQKEIVEKSNHIVADTSQTYTYQKVIIDEISTYAERAGLTPTSYTFSTAQQTAAAGAGTAPSPSAQAPSPEPSPGGAAQASTTLVTLALDSNITYESLFTFLQLLEGSLLRMEIDNLSLSRATASTEGDSSGSLGISSLNIKVHTQ